MPLTDVTVPYELLFRFGDGVLQGAHYQARRVVSDGDTILADQLGPAQPVALVAGDPGVPIADVLGVALTAAIARADQETTRADAAEAALDAATAEVARLQALVAGSAT